MVAANKADLLPSVATPARVTQWVRLRLRALGLPPVDKVGLLTTEALCSFFCYAAASHYLLRCRGSTARSALAACPCGQVFLVSAAKGQGLRDMAEVRPAGAARHCLP